MTIKSLFNSKTNITGWVLIAISVPLVIILKGTFQEWALFAGAIFTGMTVKNTVQAKVNGPVENAA